MLTREDFEILVSALAELSDTERRGFFETLDLAATAQSIDARRECIETARELLRNDPLVIVDLEINPQDMSEKLREYCGIVAENVKRLREQSGLSQLEVSIHTGIRQEYLERLEQGLTSPSHLVRTKLAEVFGCTEQEIDGDT